MKSGASGATRTYSKRGRPARGAPLVASVASVRGRVARFRGGDRVDPSGAPGALGRGNGRRPVPRRSSSARTTTDLEAKGGRGAGTGAYVRCARCGRGAEVRGGSFVHDVSRHSVVPGAFGRSDMISRRRPVTYRGTIPGVGPKAETGRRATGPPVVPATVGDRPVTTGTVCLARSRAHASRSSVRRPGRRVFADADRVSPAAVTLPSITYGADRRVHRAKSLPTRARAGGQGSGRRPTDVSGLEGTPVMVDRGVMPGPAAWGPVTYRVKRVQGSGRTRVRGPISSCSHRLPRGCGGSARVRPAAGLPNRRSRRCAWRDWTGATR